MFLLFVFFLQSHFTVQSLRSVYWKNSHLHQNQSKFGIVCYLEWGGLFSGRIIGLHWNNSLCVQTDQSQHLNHIMILWKSVFIKHLSNQQLVLQTTRCFYVQHILYWYKAIRESLGFSVWSKGTSACRLDEPGLSTLWQVDNPLYLLGHNCCRSPHAWTFEAGPY